MLAVKVDFKTRQATIGSKAGAEAPLDAVMSALKSLGYRGELVSAPTGGR